MKLENMLIELKAEMSRRSKDIQISRVSSLYKISTSIAKLKTHVLDRKDLLHAKCRESTSTDHAESKVLNSLLTIEKDLLRKVESLMHKKQAPESPAESIDRVYPLLMNILSEGDVEDDERFVHILDDTIKLFENLENEDFLRLSVQFGLARRYICDIIDLKKALSRRATHGA